MTQDADHQFPAADFADRFEVVETFEGGEGVTALLRDLKSGGKRICKVLDASFPAAEASLLLSLHHPAIPAVRQVGEIADGRMFLLRDYVAGQPVSELMPLSPEQAHALTQQTLEALAFVHLRGVLHLDLKPANILLDEQNKLHLLDFGLGVRRGRQSTGGTLFFAAPELLLGGSTDPRSDLFSLGAVLVATLWPRKSKLPLAQFLRNFPKESFWSAADIQPGEFPAPFPEFLERCLSRQPQKRFADAQEALEFLVGGAGRPTLALLQPDPVALFGDECLAAAEAAGRADLSVLGDNPQLLEALALHLLSTRNDVHGYTLGDSSVLVRRAGGPAVEWRVPPLDSERLTPFLREILSLPLDVARGAAQYLIELVGPEEGRIAATLVEYVNEGTIVPDGAKWSWPKAAQGRLSAPQVSDDDQTAISPQALRNQAAAGGSAQAEQRFSKIPADLPPEEERALRRGLVQGLLLGGEPVRALPLCGDLPIERIQSLLDLGRTSDAESALANLDTTTGTPEDPETATMLVLVAARLNLAHGRVEAALRLLDSAGKDNHHPAIQQTKAAVLETLGRGDEARSLLLSLVPKLSKKTTPFLLAASLTSLGHAERRLGDLDAAHQCFDDARRLLLRLGHARHAATTAANLGVVTKDMQRFDEALEHHRQARGLFLHVGDRAGAAIAEANLGSVALAAGDAVAAQRRLEPAIETLRELGSHTAADHATVLLARALAAQQQSDEVERLLLELTPQASARLGSEIEQIQKLLDRSPAATPEDGPPQAPADGKHTETKGRGQHTVQEPTGPSRELFRTFLSVNRRLAHESDLEKAMVTLLESAITLTGGRQGYLLVARPDGLQREFTGGEGHREGQAFSRSLANRAMQQQRTLTGEDALADRELQEMPSIRNLQVRSAICAPFQSATKAEGAIYVEHAGRAGAFSEQDKESLEVLADQAAIAVDRMLREEDLANELEHSRRELAVVKRSVQRSQTPMIGASSKMDKLRSEIEKLAPLELSVLILGETGTGKELVARAIHNNSQQSQGPFVAENCAALPPELMERELFGHVAGSFTGADRDRPGLLELASSGTLFLDEVGDMPGTLQAKLLRALQEKRIRRIGSSKAIDVDVRILSATHKDLRGMVARGEFREDLFFRLAAVEIMVPPLRDRDGDIAILAEHFISRLRKQHGVERALSPQAIEQLKQYRWPGNVRELEHVTARAFLLADGPTIEDTQLPGDQQSSGVPAKPLETQAPQSDAAANPGPAPWPAIKLAEAERRTILAALEHCSGEKAAAARLLGISRTALYEKLKRYNADQKNK